MTNSNMSKVSQTLKGQSWWIMIFHPTSNFRKRSSSEKGWHRNYTSNYLFARRWCKSPKICFKGCWILTPSLRSLSEPRAWRESGQKNQLLLSHQGILMDFFRNLKGYPRGHSQPANHGFSGKTTRELILETSPFSTANAPPKRKGKRPASTDS